MAAHSMIEADGITATGEPWAWIHPIDELEAELKPADQVRDARMAAVHLLNDFASELIEALSDANPIRTALTRLYSIAYAMGLNVCGDLSMSERADQLGVERATLSKIACAWNTAHDLAPSFHQKSTGANETYARARREVVQSSNGTTPHKKARIKSIAKHNGELPPVPMAGRSV